MTTRGRWLAALVALSTCTCLALALGSLQRFGGGPLRLVAGGRQFELGEPAWLAGLALLPLFAVPSLLSLRAQPGRRVLSTALRTLVAALLLLALSQPAELIAKSRSSTLVLVDTSESVEDAFLARAEARIADLCRARGADPVAVVTFAREAQLVVRGCEQGLPARRPGDGRATDIEGALLFSLAQFEPDSARRLVLFSDGVETHGTMARAGAVLCAAGVRLFFAAPEATAAREAGIEQLELPDVVKAGAPFAVRASIRATHAAEARVRLLRDGQPEPGGEVPIALLPGSNTVSLRSLCRTPGKPVYRLELLLDGPAP